jgi:hypothetical protein
MKPHEHGLASLSYAGIAAGLSGQDITNWRIYLAAVVGGELIDLIDHSLYHLNPQKPGVRKLRDHFHDAGSHAKAQILATRKAQAGRKPGLLLQLTSTYSYLSAGAKAYLREANRMENARVFKGLFLHNVHALSFFTLLGIGLSLYGQLSQYVYVFLGAWLLHMLTDIAGDYYILGHVDNWLWVLSKRTIRRWAANIENLAFGIIAWIGFVLFGFFVVTVRWGLHDKITGLGQRLFELVTENSTLMGAYLIILVIVFYLLSILVCFAANVHKYNLELSDEKIKYKMPITNNSLRLLQKLFTRSNTQETPTLESLILKVQSDQIIWTVVLIIVICTMLLAMTSLGVNYDVILFVVPAACALLFGTFIHTTVGQFGGVFGIIIAWAINIFFARLGIQPQWEFSKGILLVFSGAVAWVVGLLSGMILRGKIRMSLSLFSIDLHLLPDAIDGRYAKEIKRLVADSLERGFTIASKAIFGEEKRPTLTDCSSARFFLSSNNTGLISSEDHYHLECRLSYSPLISEAAYAYCYNYFTAEELTKGKFGLLPVMPRTRTDNHKHVNSDVYWSGGKYQWRSSLRAVCFPTPESLASKYIAREDIGILTKTCSEVLDNLLTRRTTICIDVVITPSIPKDGSITITGIVRESTSTKEYSTIEAEAFAAAVLEEFMRNSKISSVASIRVKPGLRIIFPKASFFDTELVNNAGRDADLLVDNGNLSDGDFSRYLQAIARTPSNEIIPHTTTEFWKKTGLWTLEVTFLTVVALFGLDQNFSQVITSFFGRF